jgi:hypothetical protein
LRGKILLYTESEAREATKVPTINRGDFSVREVEKDLPSARSICLPLNAGMTAE